MFVTKDDKQVLCDCLLHVMLLLTMDANQLCKFCECELFFSFIFLFSLLLVKSCYSINVSLVQSHLLPLSREILLPFSFTPFQCWTS